MLRMAGMLAEGGKLCLRDVVYSFDPAEHEKFLDEFISKAAEKAGPQFARSISEHVQNEYSTMDWIMQGMIERAGFEIERATHSHGFFALYLCTKTTNRHQQKGILMIDLDEDDLRQLCTESSFDKGERYFEEGRVRITEATTTR